MPSHRLPVIAKTPFLVMLGYYLAGGTFEGSAIYVTMLLVSSLWALLYMLNEAYDLEIETHGAVSPQTQRVLIGLCLVICIVSAWFSPPLALLQSLMLIGQLIYCQPPLRIKRFWWAAPLLSGLLNPALRIFCGAMWGSHPIAPLAIATCLLIHLGASIRSRVLLRERDRRFGYRIAPPKLEWLGILCTAGGLVSGYLLCRNQLVPTPFIIFCPIATLFAGYAWFGNTASIARLRKAWLIFALLSLLAMGLLWFHRAIF